MQEHYIKTKTALLLSKGEDGFFTKKKKKKSKVKMQSDDRKIFLAPSEEHDTQDKRYNMDCLACFNIKPVQYILFG